MFTLLKVKNEEEVIHKLCDIIQTFSAKAIERDGYFTIGLSGGSLVKYLSKGLPNIQADWSKWTLLFCDERVVPVESEDSTFGCYKKELLGKVPLKEEQFLTIKQGVSAEDAAADYRRQIERFVRPPVTLPRFHMLLLGMGPDGHTCSLFPGHTLLQETSLSVAPIVDSPKPPPQRITLTYPVINNAECCIFALHGKGKAQTVKKVLKDKEDIPAGRVKPTTGELYWILDEDAWSMD